LVPLELARTGAELIEERDFSCKFLETGQPEMDRLVRVYNRMIDQLREERTRLQEQRHFTEAVMAASPSGIIVFDFDGRVSAVNPSAARLLQVPEAELTGKGLEESGAPLLQALAPLEADGAQVVALQGRRRVRCRKARFTDRGFPRRFVLVEELTEELRQSEKAAYEKLIRLMAHEVNNSIGAANSLLHSCLHYREQLRREDREDFAGALRVVIDRTDHLTGFMQRFAEVIRLPPPRLQEVDLEELLRGIERLMQAESRQRGIEWVWERRAPLDPIRMDRFQMEQVFVNILKNAVEAIGQQGRITLRTGREEGRPYAQIEDSGCGIAPEAREHLFTPFFSTKRNGQGIGLTLVQEVLGRHGFEFSLESRPGEPTRFSVFFR
jgi:nitrogen fixation/metabolism regulation signal transduction histidine kinase